MSVREMISTRVTCASALTYGKRKMTIDKIQTARARKRSMSSLQREHSLHHCLPKPIPLMQISYIGVRSNFSRTTLSLAGSNGLHLPWQGVSNAESGARTDWKTASQSWLKAASSVTVSFVNVSLKGGGIEMKRLTGARTVTPSVVTNSMVKSGDSRSFFLDGSSFSSLALSFFLSFLSFFFFPGTGASSSSGAIESSIVDAEFKCQFRAAPAGNVIA